MKRAKMSIKKFVFIDEEQERKKDIKRQIGLNRKVLIK
jgi:hypothetical protein